MARLIQDWLARWRRKWRVKRWRYIVWHTAAHGNPQTGQVYDTTAEEIDRWHKAQGWQRIGYHFVVRMDGSIEEGRRLDEVGAHVKGLNAIAIGICFSGHGDLQPLTEPQWRAGIALSAALCKSFSIPVHHVIGHREANSLVRSKGYMITKSCPGKLVDMRRVRTELMEVLYAIQE